MESDDVTNQKLAYGICDALSLVSVGRSLLYKEIKAGRLRTFKIGSRTLISHKELSSWLSHYAQKSH